MSALFLIKMNWRAQRVLILNGLPSTAVVCLGGELIVN